MLHLNVWLKVTEEANIGRVAELLAEAGRLSRSEPGCLRFDVFHSESEPTRFLLSERWAEKADWERHRTAAAYTTIYQPQVLPLVTREPHPSRLLE